MKSAVIVFPGSNCDRDMAVALTRATGREAEMVWHKDAALPGGLDLIAIPGGFSFGDYLRCGAIAARAPIMRAVVEFANRGGLVLGVCNGFQVLIEAGLLPGALMRNQTLKFVCRDVHLVVETTDSPFTNAYGNHRVITVPIAHPDGAYVAETGLLEPEQLDQIEREVGARIDAAVAGAIGAAAPAAEDLLTDVYASY